MKKLLLLPLVLLLLVSVSFAYDLSVQSSTNSAITLAFSNLESLDIRFIDVTATAESETSTGTYVVEPKVNRDSEVVLLTVDVSDLKSENPNLQSILVSGNIELNGVSEEFSKRISLRSEPTPVRSMAPELSSSEMIYWILGLVVLVVIMAVLFIFLREPKEIVITEKKIRRKKAKKSKAKKKVKKAKKKRL